MFDDLQSYDPYAPPVPDAPSVFDTPDASETTPYGALVEVAYRYLTTVLQGPLPSQTPSFPLPPPKHLYRDAPLTQPRRQLLEEIENTTPPISKPYPGSPEGLHLVAQILGTALLPRISHTTQHRDRQRAYTILTNDPTQWPPYEDLLLFQDSLILDLQQPYASKGPQAVHLYLRSQYNFTYYEASYLVPLVHDATIQAHQLSIVNMDDQRVLATARINDFIARAQEACSLQAEIRGLKELHLVLGLGKVEPENSVQAFTEAIRAISQDSSPSPSSPSILEAKIEEGPTGAIAYVPAGVHTSPQGTNGSRSQRSLDQDRPRRPGQEPPGTN